MFMPSATYMYFCCASRENAMPHTEPAPSVFGATVFSFTKDPSFLKSWMRSLFESHTYTRPSLDNSAQRTTPNCLGDAPGVYFAVSASLGFAPYAPQMRLIAPVFMSITATRWLR